MITFGSETEPARGSYGRYQPQFREGLPVNFYNVMGAAARQENTIVNLLEVLDRPTFKPDPAFDFAKRAQGSELFQNLPEHFLGVSSDAQWDWTEARLAKEAADREMIAAAGIGGIGAAMFMGTADPTIMIPAVNAARAASVGKAAIKTGAYTGAIVAGQEGLLHLNQSMRTTTESGFAIGGGAVLGSILGSAVRYLDPLDLDRLSADMVQQPNGQTIQTLAENTRSAEPRALSAQATPEDLIDYVEPVFKDPGQIAETFLSPIAKRLGIENIANFSWLGPITRGLASPRAAIRQVFGQFGNAGLLTELGLRGEAAAAEGALEQVVKQHYAGFARVNREQKLLFKNYLLEQGASGAGAELRARFPGGAYKDFIQEVGDELFKRVAGQPGSDTAASRAADAYLTKVFDAEIKAAKNAGLAPFARISDEYARQMVLQKMKPLAIAEDYNAAKQIVYENALEQLRQSRLKGEEFELRIGGEDIAKGEVDSFVAKAIQDGLSIEDLRGAREVNEKGKTTVAFASDEELDMIADLISERILERHLSNFQRHGALDILKQIDEKQAKFVYIDPTRTWSNGRVWGEFLERDAEKLSRSFIRSIGADIEIYRRFKLDFRSDKDFTIKEHKDVPFVSTILDESKKLREEVEKKKTDGKLNDKQYKQELQKIFDQERRAELDLQTLFARLRHTQGMPADPTHIGHRLGRAALQLNTMRLMGSVALASIPDLARTTLKYGFMTTMRDGVIPMLRNFREFKMSAEEARHAGEALDVLLHSRLGALAELFDEIEYGNMAERMMQYGTSLTGKLALFDYWNAGLKQFTGAMTNAQLGRVFDKLDAGAELSGRELRLLGQLNIGVDSARKMAKIIRNGGGSRTASGVWLPNTEDWVRLRDDEIEAKAIELWKRSAKGPIKKGYPSRKGNLDAGKGVTLKGGKKSKDLGPYGTANIKEFLPFAERQLLGERQHLQRIYRAGIAQAISDTIVTPGLERPNWVDATTLGRLISQFRSFTLSSTFKVGVAAGQELRQGNMAPIANGAFFSLALGLVSYYTWATSVGDNTREKMLNEFEDAINGDTEALSRIADESINRSGLTGLFAEMQKFAERTPGLEPYATFAGEATSRSPFVNPVEELLGPTRNLIGNAGRIVATLNDPTSETFRKGKQLLPYQNIFYFRRFLDAANEALMDASGVPYR